MPTAIEWTDETWNPVVGCTKVSPGCKLCYAKTLHDKRHQAHREGKRVPLQYARPFEAVQLMPDRLWEPLTWKAPRRVFVNSVSDLFHEDVPDDFLDRAFAVMGVAHWHTFQVLTKRPERAAAYFAETFQVPEQPAGFFSGIDIPAQPARSEDRWARINAACDGIPAKYLRDRCWTPDGSLIGRPAYPRKPFPNVWIGASVEDQQRADERIPELLKVPAAVRFLSMEPLLGPVDLEPYLWNWEAYPQAAGPLGWVIVGGESGPGARPMHPDWPRSLRDQCVAAGVPYFFKQHGEWAPQGSPHTDRNGLISPAGDFHEQDRIPLGIGRHPVKGYSTVYRVGKKHAGRLLDGQKWSQFPEVGR